MIAKLWCWFGWHDWKFTLVHTDYPHQDDPGAKHYTGRCQRCSAVDLFFGPYDSDEPTDVEDPTLPD